MPLYKTLTPNSKTEVKIWKIEESYEDLFQSVNLKPESLRRVLGMKSTLHQRGFLSVRRLLEAFGYSDFDLSYEACGKPHLKDGKHISITHSFHFSAIIISEDIIGIDIEKQRQKIAIIAHKFIEYEASYLIENDVDYIKKLTAIWCIKESLFKLFATPGLSFKKHCLVIPVSDNDTETVAWIDYGNSKYKYHITLLEFEGFTCAFALK